MTVTVYSKLGCPQCDATYRALLLAGIGFKVVNLAGNQDAIDFAKELGHLQAPIVVAGDMHWSGYRPDMIKLLVRNLTDQGVELTPHDKDAVADKIKQIKQQLAVDNQLTNPEPAMATA